MFKGFFYLIEPNSAQLFHESGGTFDERFIGFECYVIQVLLCCGQVIVCNIESMWNFFNKLCINNSVPTHLHYNNRIVLHVDMFLQIHNQPANEKEKRMTARRCAELTAVAIANRVSEAWVAQQPYLVAFYAAQYMPDFTRWYAHHPSNEML